MAGNYCDICLITLAPGVNVIKLLFFVTHVGVGLASVYVLADFSSLV